MIDSYRKALREEYPYLTELHTHTMPLSPCSDLSAAELVDAYERIGVHTLVLTNHISSSHMGKRERNEYLASYSTAYHELRAYADSRGIDAIFGMELRFTENINDYLVFGIGEEELARVSEYFERGIADFYKDFSGKDVLIVQAHPGRKNMEEVDPAYLDGIEAFNLYPDQNSRVAIAARRANSSGLIITGGSDCHRLGNEGCCLVRTRKRIRSADVLVSTLKSREYILDVGGSLLLV